MKKLLLFAALLIAFSACKKDETPDNEGPNLLVKLKFDPTQERLGPLGQPATIPSGNAALTPEFNGMSVHFIELVKTQWTPYKDGAEVYMGAETSKGGSTAIDFDQAIVKNADELFLKIPLSSLANGSYQHIRASVSYQNYDVRYNINNIPVVGNLNNERGTIASFLGYNCNITNVTPRTMSETVNANKRQGFWAFETDFSAPYSDYNLVAKGEAPEGATTVVNPFEAAIPPGSCVVGGTLDQTLEITGEETQDITLTLSFSNNQSFEWQDLNGNGEWDLDANGTGSEPVVDMGLRGLKVLVEQ